MKKSDVYGKSVVGTWQKVSSILLFATLVFTALMVILATLDNAFDLFPYGSFMYEFYERLISPSSLIIFYFPVFFCSFIPECLWFDIVVALICVLFLVLIVFFTLNIFKENAKSCVRIWLITMIFESLISFALVFVDIISILILAFRIFTVFSLFMSLKFIDSHYEHYDY